MNQERDDEIEALLLRQFAPVSDEGFSDRVMRALPPRRRRATWPLWSGILMGAVACWLVLLHSPLLRLDWVSGDWSASAVTMLLAMLGVATLALVWGVAEAEDR